MVKLRTQFFTTRSVSALVVCLLMATAGVSAQEATRLLLISLPGDPIGQGLTYSTEYASDMTVSTTPTTVTFTAIGFSLTMAAPGQSRLAVGQYSNALEYPSNGNAPGISVSGFGRSCTNACGSFEIFDIQTNAAGQVTEFLGTLKQFCSCTGASLTAEIRYNSLLILTNVPARTLYVPADYPSIQAAIDNASILGLDTVLVAPGRYVENIDFRGKAVSVISKGGPEQTIIDGNRQGSVVSFRSGEGSNSVISGFTLENGLNCCSGDGGGGITASFSSPTIAGNIFRDNQEGASSGAGISCNGSSPIIVRNLFIHNRAYGGVIASVNSSGPLISNNIFFDNRGAALNLRYPLLINNTFVSNDVAIVFPGDGASYGFYLNNVLVRNGVAVLWDYYGTIIDSVPNWQHNLVYGDRTYVGIKDQTGTNGNISSDPFFACEPQGNFHLLPGSPCIDAGTNSSMLDATDFDGHPRILAGLTNAAAVVDLGAFEFDFANPSVACPFLVCPSNIVVVSSPGGHSVVVNYPPPFTSPAAVLTNWPPSGFSFPLGLNNVSVTSTLYATNVLNCGFTVLVLTVDDFAQSLDTSNIVWTAGGNAPWFVQTAITHDGLAAAQSGAITDNQNSTLQTTLMGPSLLTFWWKVSSETNHDLLSVTVNGSTQAVISGSLDWRQQTFYLGSGRQVVQWIYSKDASGSAGQDAAWLDQVTWTSGFYPPQITRQPANASVGPGMSAGFSVTAVGTPPLSYQWLFNGNILEGATDSALTITNAGVANVGAYTVQVMNQGATSYSSNATLRLAEVLAWGANSFGQTNVPDDLTNVAAIAGGWHHSMALRSNGTVVVWGANNRGQTNVPPGLSNVVAIASRSGDFCMALRVDGTVAVWGDFSYGLTNVPAGLSNVVAIAAGGYHWLALKGDGTAVSWGNEKGVPPGLSNIVAVSAGDFASLFLRSDGTVAATTFVPPYVSNIVAIAAGGMHYLALRADGTVVGWGNNSYGQISIPAGLSNIVAIAAGDYHSTALRSDGTVVVWGKYSTGFGSDFFTPIVPAGLANVVGIAAGSDHDLALFRKIVPPFFTSQPSNEIVVAGTSATFSVTAGPTDSYLIYQWRFNETNNIPFATNSSLILPNVQSADAGLYSVRVSNLFGAIVSSNAVLKVDHPPVADASATSSQAVSSNGLSATVILDGSRSSDPDNDPLQYSWFLDGNSEPTTLLGTGVVTVVVLPVGVQLISLVVSDGFATSTNAVTVTVLTASQAVAQLNSMVEQSGLTHFNSLGATLVGALAALSRNNVVAAVSLLKAFEDEVKAEVASSNPAVAQALIAGAQDVIDALQFGTHVTLKRGADCNVRLIFIGVAGQTYTVEASTNLANWKATGLACEQAQNVYEFEDAAATNFPSRFYRVQGSIPAGTEGKCPPKSPSTNAVGSTADE